MRNEVLRRSAPRELRGLAAPMAQAFAVCRRTCALVVAGLKNASTPRSRKEFKPHGMEPIAPKPPAEIETITKKLLNLIPYRMYFVEHQRFHRKKNAQRVIYSLTKEHESQMEKYKLTHNLWAAHKSSYENQQAKIKEYDLI